MVCKEGPRSWHRYNSVCALVLPGVPLSIIEDDWEGPLCPLFRTDILFNVILSLPGTLTVSCLVK
jgi:hypothetical protein